MITPTKERLEKLTERMYNVNRYISSHYVTRLAMPKYEDMDNLNEFIANWIKEIREIITSDEMFLKENKQRKQLQGKYGKQRKEMKQDGVSR